MRDEDGREDTLKILLDESRRALADVSTILSRGRIKTAHAEHAISTYGSWSVGTIFRSDDLAIFLYVAFEKSHDKPPVNLCHKQRAIYLGKRGKANIYRGKTGYVRIAEATFASIDPGEEHSLEPVEVGAQVLTILLGGGEADVER